MSSGVEAFGNPKQQAYATDLAKRMGYESLDAALRAVSADIGYDLGETKISVRDASAFITAMERRVPPRQSEKGAQDAAGTRHGGEARQRYLTARQLRRIATYQEPVPSDLDEDAKWVLGALARLKSLEYLMSRGTTYMPLAVNGNAPIPVASVIEFFGSPAATAAAFGVSEKTLTGWGELVPQAHQWRAEVMTQGYVVVPRD